MAIIQANNGSIWELDGIQEVAAGEDVANSIVCLYSNGNVGTLTFVAPPFVQELEASSDEVAKKKGENLVKDGKDAQLANCAAAVAIGNGAQGTIELPGYMVLDAVSITVPEAEEEAEEEAGS